MLGFIRTFNTSNKSIKIEADEKEMYALSYENSAVAISNDIEDLRYIKQTLHLNYQIKKIRCFYYESSNISPNTPANTNNLKMNYYYPFYFQENENPSNYVTENILVIPQNINEDFSINNKYFVNNYKVSSITKNVLLKQYYLEGIINGC